jgi:hypothetical protein
MSKGFLGTILAGIALVVPFAVISPVYAQSGSNSNTIWEGLWSGINLHIGGQSSNTTKKPSSKSTASTSTSQSRGIYAALGDSVAAGQGLSGSSSDSQCGRSSQAYAHKVSRERNLQLVHAACSGATAGDLLTQQHISGTNPRPQLDAAFSKGTPELITSNCDAISLHAVAMWMTVY